jgi:hypothetical protein
MLTGWAASLLMRWQDTRGKADLQLTFGLLTRVLIYTASIEHRPLPVVAQCCIGSQARKECWVVWPLEVPDT